MVLKKGKTKSFLRGESSYYSLTGYKTSKKGKNNMKKFAKRLISSALAGAMALSMGAFPAFAAQGNDGKIVITNPSVDVQYSAYKIFDMDYSGDNYTYTIDEDSKFFRTVSEYAADENDSDGLTLTQIGNSTTYNVTTTDKFSAANFGVALKGVADKGAPAATENDTTTTKNLVLGENMAYGYYLVIGEKNGSTESLVSLDSTNTTAEIVEKNNTPGWHSEDPENPDIAKGKTIKITENGQERYVETTDLNIGDTVTFAIKIDAKNYVNDNLVTSYIIVDSLPDGFTFNEITAVKVNNTTLAESTENAKNTYKNDGFPYKTEEKSGRITIPWASGSDEEGWESFYDPDSLITVEYTATLDSDAVIDGPGNVNKALFTETYGKTPENPEPDEPWEIPENPDEWTHADTATVYTYGIAIKKINKDGESLEGATFSLPAGMKVSPVDGKTNTYIVDKNGTIETITTSGTDASFTIIGVDAGTYNFTETAAPSGYNKLATPVSVEAQLVSETTTTTNKTFYLDENGNIVENETDTTATYTNSDYAVTPVAVVNLTGAELPSTGGVGTTMFYVIGGILVAGAAILLVTKRRMSVK